MAVIQEISLDVLHLTQFVSIRIQQGDNTDRKIDVLITENNEPYIIPSTAQVILRMLKKDGKPIFNTCSKLGENKVQFTITPEMSVLDGRCPAQIQINDSGSGGELKTIKFHMLIDEGVYDDSLIVSTGEFTALQDALTRVGDVSNIITNAEEATADAIEATTNANNATTSANTSTDNANLATTNAIEATNLANTAATTANTSATNADIATGNANQAISSMNNLNQTVTSQEDERQDFYDAYKVCEPYNNSKQYVVANKVVYGGSTYQCILDSNGVVPTNPTNWLQVASKGADGTGGDMMATVFDPTGKADDAFNAINHSYSNATSDLSSTTTQSAIDELDSIIGDKSLLTTESNTDLVGAVNELDSDIGDTLSLNTDNKSSLVGAINENASNLLLKTNQSKTSIIYNRALNEMTSVPKDSLSQALSAIASGTLKIAIWADSISLSSGNDSTDTSDTYAERLIKTIREKLPNTSITFQNFSLGGTTIYLAANSAYVGGTSTIAGETFKTSWSIEGKSWKDHVKDFAPDLLIIAFGMNDAGGTIYDEYEAIHLGTILDYTLTWTKKPSNVIVPTILPTTNSAYYNQSNNLTLAISRASRLFAKSRKLAIADASRLYQILRDGKDDVTRSSRVEMNFEGYDTYWTGNVDQFIQTDVYLAPVTNASNIYVYNDKEFFNGTIFTNFTPSLEGIAGEMEIRYRYTEDLGFFKIIIGAGASDGYLRFYDNDGATDALLKEVTGLSIPVSAVSQFAVIVSDNKHDVYLNGAYLFNFITYKNLHNGSIGIGSKATPPTFHAMSLTYSEPIKGEPLYTELELLGEYSSIQSGNSINHPTGLGHALFYLPAFNGVINELANGNSLKTSEVTITESFGVNCTGKCIKNTETGLVKLALSINTGVANGSTITTLPSSVYPSTVQSCRGLAKQTTGIGRCILSVRTDGAILMSASDYNEPMEGVSFNLFWKV